MYRPRPTQFRSSSKPAFLSRQLKVEPLEDRRMLSVLFVDADAAEGGDGSAWASAYRDLQSALSAAETLNSDTDAGNDVDQIWIAEGVYRPSAELEAGDVRSAGFSLVDGVTLYGGFEGTEGVLGERDWSNHETVLSGDLGVPDEAGDNAYTVVLCPEGVEAAVDGLTISQGNANGSSSSEHPEMREGGGVHNSGTMTVRNSDVSKNSAYFGGGVFNSRGNLTIVDCGFEENHVTLYGGAIYNTYGTVAATDSTISGNSADSSGGALCSDRGIISLTDSTFSANAAERSVGGAIRSSHDTLTITGSTFEANSASSTGGAIHVEWGELTIADSLLRGNTAADGGAVYNYGTALDVTDTTISENTADDDGGGVYSTKENATFTNVTFERNTTDGAGGGIYGTEGEITVSDSSFSENEAEEAGGAIYRAGSELLSISNTDLTSNASAGSGGAVYSAGGIFSLANSTLQGTPRVTAAPSIVGPTRSPSRGRFSKKTRRIATAAESISTRVRGIVLRLIS